MKRNAFDGAELKGVQAAQRGESETSCPYWDIRKLDGRLTFSRAFRKAWFRGYRSVKKVNHGQTKSRTS